MNSIIVRYYLDDLSLDAYEQKEIAELVKSAEFNNLDFICFKEKEISPKTHLTSGRVDMVRQKMDGTYVLTDQKVEAVICDFDLTAIQKKNLEKALGVDVIDRTTVILKIFEQSAHTPESIKQVEIAKLQYLKSHLVDNVANYSQVTSGSGAHNKGVGEKQIELDRRKIEKMIKVKEDELAKIKLRRSNSRSKRSNSSLPKISIVGYTNAGKSTLLNLLLKKSHALSNKEVLSQDKLFATLETSTRLVDIYRYPNFILTDTVGFVQDLPTFLVDAFRSTLEEIQDSDLLVQVVDISSPLHVKMIETTNEILKELGADNIPMVYLFNKYDLLDNPSPELITNLNVEGIFTSFINEDDAYEVIKYICQKITKGWKKEKIFFPYSKDFVSFQKEHYVTSYIPTDDGYECEVYINPRCSLPIFVK